MGMLKRNSKRVVGTLLLLLFAGYWASVSLFPHTHVIDGQKIVHSHPYSEAPDTGSHSHSSSQLQAIAHLSVFLALAATLCGMLSVFAPAATVAYAERRCGIQTFDALGFSLRAPPAC